MHTCKIFKTLLHVASFAVNLLVAEFPAHVSGKVKYTRMTTGTGNFSVHRSSKGGNRYRFVMAAEARDRVDGQPALGVGDRTYQDDHYNTHNGKIRIHTDPLRDGMQAGSKCTTGFQYVTRRNAKSPRRTPPSGTF